jgi:hypothetical protein
MLLVYLGSIMPALSQNLTFAIYNSTSSVAVVYPNTGTSTIVYKSVPVKGDGYYGASDGMHTVSYTATPTFVGSIYMQASLATQPLESDWFKITDTTVIYTEQNSRSTATVDYFNFIGNFVWVRGVVSIGSGTVNEIQYNH